MNTVSKDMLEKISLLGKSLQKWKIPLILSCVGFALVRSLGAISGGIHRGADSDPIAKFIISHFSDEAGHNGRMETRKNKTTE